MKREASIQSKSTQNCSKVENSLKGSLDLIPLPSSSVESQIMGVKVCLWCKGKTLLGIVNKILKQKFCWRNPAIFYHITSDKVSCQWFEFSRKVKVVGSNPGYLLKSFLLYILGMYDFAYSGASAYGCISDLCRKQFSSVKEYYAKTKGTKKSANHYHNYLKCCQMWDLMKNYYYLCTFQLLTTRFHEFSILIFYKFF